MNDTEIARRREEAGARLSEDESLTGDLSDDEAAPLLAWARACAEAGAQHAALSAEAFDAFLHALHKATRRGARASDPSTSVDTARAALSSLGWTETGHAAHELATVPESALSLLSFEDAAPREPGSDE